NRHGAISQWDVASGALLPASADPVFRLGPVRFIDGGKHLLVVRDASSYAVVDWRTGREVQCFAEFAREHSTLSPDRSLLAVRSTDGKSIELLDVATGKL